MTANLSAKVAGLAFSASLPFLSGASAAELFSRDCAIQDAKHVSTIEEVATAGAVPGSTVYAAYISLLEARRTCRTGQVADALRMYGDISLRSQEATAK